jgi:hypothetical protein
MAKIGETDPRWIVQKREDGKNVNAWHWYFFVFRVIFIISRSVYSVYSVYSVLW